MNLIIVLALAVASVSSASLDFVVQPGFPEGRIINGHEAAIHEAPYIVSFSKKSHFCAGSIIGEKWVLTAAHCLLYEKFNVIAGLHNRSDESDCQIRTVSGFEYQFVHEKYGGGVGPYDIGLIFIAEPFNLNALARDGSAPVAKINLPSDNYEQTGNAKLYGWGRDNAGLLATNLQTLDANIISFPECKAALPKSAHIESSNICSYTINAADGACNGDSGGPLVLWGLTGVEIVGIVSWGYTPCAYTYYPSVYTKIAAFKEWIYNTTDAYEHERISN